MNVHSLARTTPISRALLAERVAKGRSVSRTAAIAEARGQRVVPLVNERSQDARCHVRLVSAKVERDGEHVYLVGRGKNEAGRCVTASILLEPGSEATLAAAAF